MLIEEVLVRRTGAACFGIACLRAETMCMADEARPTGPQARQDGGGTASAAHVAQSVDGGVGIARRAAPLVVY